LTLEICRIRIYEIPIMIIQFEIEISSKAVFTEKKNAKEQPRCRHQKIAEHYIAPL